MSAKPTAAQAAADALKTPNLAHLIRKLGKRPAR
jgi:hypothetical protein